jgi:hypothetical protein
MLSSKASTPSRYIWPNTNAFYMKLVVRIGQMSIKSRCSAMDSTLCYAIDLLSSSISLVSTPTLYELYSNLPVVLRLPCLTLSPLLAMATTIASLWTSIFSLSTKGTLHAPVQSLHKGVTNTDKKGSAYDAVHMIIGSMIACLDPFHPRQGNN